MVSAKQKLAIEVRQLNGVQVHLCACVSVVRNAYDVHVLEPRLDQAFQQLTADAACAHNEQLGILGARLEFVVQSGEFQNCSNRSAQRLAGQLDRWRDWLSQKAI